MDGDRSKLLDIQFAQRPAYAVHMRLTPELKEALLHANSSGQGVSVRLGNEINKTAALIVGHQEFQLTTIEEGTTDLISVPAGNNTAKQCTQIGTVKQKLHVQKTLQNIDRGRIRASAEEYERKQRDRRAVVMTSTSMPASGSRPGGVTTVTTTTTAGRQPTSSSGRLHSSGLPPKPSRASSPAAPAPRPMGIPKPGSFKAKGSTHKPKLTPPPSMPRKTPPPTFETPYQPRATTPRSSSPDSEPTPPPKDLSPAMVSAARQDNLGSCVAAALSGRALSRVAVLEAVRGAYRAAGASCPDESDVSAAVRKLAARDPSTGLYSLKKEHRGPSQKRRNDRASAEPEPPPASKKPRATDHTNPSTSHPASEPSKPEQPHGNGHRQDRPPRHPNEPSPPSSDPTTQAPSRTKDPPSHPTIHIPSRRPAHSPDSDNHPHTNGNTTPQPTSSQPHRPPTDPEAGPRPPSAQPSPYSGLTSDTGPSTLDCERSPNGRAHAAAAAAPAAAAVVPDIDPDEGEYAGCIGREPQEAGPIRSAEDLEAAKRAYTAKWGVYYRLNKKIQDFQNEMNAMWKAVQATADPAEHRRLEGVLQEAALRKGRMSNRWNAAFQVLHKELASISSAAEKYGLTAGLLPPRRPATL